jgi:hypothetical protein
MQERKWEINKGDIEELYLWLKFIRTRKKQEVKPKEFLIGRKLICDIEKESETNINGGDAIRINGTVKVTICCDLKYERWKKFRFKFRMKGNSNQLKMLNNLIKISKKMMIKAYMLKKVRLKREENKLLNPRYANLLITDKEKQEASNEKMLNVVKKECRREEACGREERKLINWESCDVSEVVAGLSLNQRISE